MKGDESFEPNSSPHKADYSQREEGRESQMPMRLNSLLAQMGE